MGNENFSCIGVFNSDTRENDAFVEFSRSFYDAGLPVPEIYSYSSDKLYYLIEDFGDQSLLGEIENSSVPPEKNPMILDLYQQALRILITFQFTGREVIDFRLCIPRDSFDRQSVLWDLNHFKYYFVKLSGIPFDEQKLENDFILLCEELEKADRHYFMYRDFQSRNIMIHNNSCHFIDFQGGRKGTLYYDVASLLFEAKTHLAFNMKEKLLDYYMDELERYIHVDREKFRKEYYGFVLIRVLQALGSYGLRGLIEKKPLFLQSIPYAIKNLEWLLEEKKIPWELAELKRIFRVFIGDPRFKERIHLDPEKLRIEINSFSYRNNLPDDPSGHGGGFIFDCRAIENPGRLPELRSFSGKDPEIEDFFLRKSRMNEFINDIFKLISPSIETYQSNNFKHLQLNFGCTGGRHRSVFAAEKIAARIKESFDVEVTVFHRELKEDKIE